MTMLYRKDARSGNEISALGFGCMRFPAKVGGIDAEATEKLILRAVELGVNYFDTAYAYAGSEEVLGGILEKHGLRQRVLVASKLPHGKCRSIEDVNRIFDKTLSRLRTDFVDYYLIHNIVTFAQWQRLVDLGIHDWIADKKRSGAVRRIGFSFHGSITEYAKVLDSFDWDFVQIQYNYVNEHYQAGREGLLMAAERGLPVIIMEPLLGGRLAVNLPRGADAVMKGARPDRSCAEWALRWLWDQPEVTCVLSGMNAMDQLEDNCRVAGEATPGCLDAGERAVIARVKEAFSRAFRVPCTGCNYCMPCPKGISIPSCFAAYNESFTLGWFTGVWHYLISIGANSAQPHLVSDCVSCGACVPKCPQGIDIPTELAAVRRRLQPAPMKPALKVASKILSK